MLPGWIFSIRCTSDNKYLFLSDNYGNLKQFCIKQKRVIKDYGVVHDDLIYSIAVSADNRFLFTSDSNGNMKQYSVEDQCLSFDFGKICSHEITCIYT